MTRMHCPPLVTLLLGLSAAAGCQQKMAEQPSYRAQAPSDFFADGRSDRPAVPGTVARGYLRTDPAWFAGRKAGGEFVPGIGSPAVVQPPASSPEAAKLARAQYDQYVDTFPFPMTEKTLEHGGQRFMIYCVVCHDPLGTGRGKIVQRGYTQPPSYHIDRLRKVPAGYLFSVISEGYGSMPAYGPQIPVRDRWAIVGYVRALQASQHFSLSDLTAEMRRDQSQQDQPLPGGRNE
jgi:mono/diheme cytochrome c family protein